MSNMTVKKSNDKASKAGLSKSEQEAVLLRKQNVVGNLNGKTLQAPLNDKPEYQNVDSEMVRVPLPEDNSVPTWRCANGKIFPMTKVKNADDAVEYKPRKKKGPTKGKKYTPRAVAKKEAEKGQASTAAVATDVFGEMTEILTQVDAVDFQALVHSWQMRSIGALNDAEFQMIKKSIFEKRQETNALTTMLPVAPVALPAAKIDSMTF